MLVKTIPRVEFVLLISASVQTQARDVGYIINHDKGKQYRVSFIVSILNLTNSIRVCARLLRVLLITDLT